MLPEDNILFKGVCSDDCQRMIVCFNTEIRKYRSGSIIPISDTGERVGVVLSGSANLLRYDINGVRTIVETLGEQGVFGEFFTFSGSHRTSVELVAETDCEVLFFRRSELLKRCENACSCHSMVVDNLLRLMSERSIALSERIEVLSQRSIEDKLLSFLQITEDNTPEGKPPKIPFSTTALSDYLCVNRSALQREITRLKNNGTLTISKRRFTINKKTD